MIVMEIMKMTKRFIDLLEHKQRMILAIEDKFIDSSMSLKDFLYCLRFVLNKYHYGRRDLND